MVTSTIDKVEEKPFIEQISTDDIEDISQGEKYIVFKEDSEELSFHKEQFVDYNELDYDSEDDPDDPANWPLRKKWFIIITLSLICFCCTLGSSIYIAGVPEMMVVFGKSREICISGLTLYLLGLSFGPFFTAPLSEVIGRRIIYISSFPIGMLFVLGIGFAKNIETVLVLRFFAGYFSSPALSLVGGTISDLFHKDPQLMSKAIAMFCLAPFAGPVLGPVIGVLLMFYGLVLPFLMTVPETYKPILLVKRAKKRGINIQGPTFSKKYFIQMAQNDLVKPIKMFISDPIVSVLSIYIAFVFAVLFAFFEAYPVIFMEVYQMDVGEAGLPFLGIGIGVVSGLATFAIINKYLFFPKEGKVNKYTTPESTFIVCKIGSVCLPISLFWLGWTSKPSIHPLVPIAAGIPFGFGLLLVFFNVLLYFSKCYPPSNVASAVAVNNLFRYFVAAIFPLFTVQMFTNLQIKWACSLFGFIALGMVSVPFIFERYGAKLRANSKYCGVDKDEQREISEV
ncbi:polyamine transport protein [Scheffersomyces coipomensis]|uniref:polyamine transport protein n=1 Tax=Scheffersomyces coipomensis TaxID=1788519 RepID=UPI00315DD1B7